MGDVFDLVFEAGWVVADYGERPFDYLLGVYGSEVYVL